MSKKPQSPTPPAKDEQEPQEKEARAYKITNACQAPITLATKAQKVTVLPGQTEEVSAEFMEDISANKAALNYFADGRLKEG